MDADNNYKINSEKLEEIIFNLKGATLILDLCIRNISNNATASQYSNCKHARDILNETLKLL